MSEILVFTFDTNHELVEAAATEQAEAQPAADQQEQSPVVADLRDFEVDPIGSFLVVGAFGAATIWSLLRGDRIRIAKPADENQASS